MRNRLQRSTAVIAGTLALLVVSSCADSTGVDLPPATTTPTDLPTTFAPDEGDHERKSRTPDTDAIGSALTGITVSRHDGFDRVEFAFSGGAVPGWAVQYVDHAVQNGTQAPLEVPGRSIIEVLVREAASPFEGATSYTGPPDVANPDAPAIAVVRFSSVERGTTQAFIGVNAQQPAFRVSATTGPTRVVVDIRNQAGQ